jgi:hypothetical protein
LKKNQKALHRFRHLRLRSPGIDFTQPMWPGEPVRQIGLSYWSARACICKSLRSQGIDSEESIPDWELIPGLLKHLQIRAQYVQHMLPKEVSITILPTVGVE